MCGLEKVEKCSRACASWNVCVCVCVCSELKSMHSSWKVYVLVWVNCHCTCVCKRFGVCGGRVRMHEVKRAGKNEFD